MSISKGSRLSHIYGTVYKCYIIYCISHMIEILCIPLDRDGFSIHSFVHDTLTTTSNEETFLQDVQVLKKWTAPIFSININDIVLHKYNYVLLYCISVSTTYNYMYHIQLYVCNRFKSSITLYCYPYRKG